MAATNRTNLWGLILAGGEGTRVQSFLAQHCGGKGIKQFCAIIGRRSMLQHTVARAEKTVPREHVLVSLNSHHRREAVEQLYDLPFKNLVFQPANLDTAPGILLPLAHISVRDPDAIVAVFPSDHFIADEETFLERLDKAVHELQYFAGALILMGVSPQGPDNGYGWIEPGEASAGRAAITVRGFWEKPDPVHSRRLKLAGCLWNTFVFVCRAKTLWEIVATSAPRLYQTFWNIRLMLHSIHASTFVEHIYQTLRPVNFSSAILAQANSYLRVVRVPEVGWSDWGTEERILASLKEIGKLDEFLQQPERAQQLNKPVPRLDPLSKRYAAPPHPAEPSPS